MQKAHQTSESDQVNRHKFYKAFFPNVSRSYRPASIHQNFPNVSMFDLLYGQDMCFSVPFVFVPFFISKDEISEKCLIYFHGNGEDLGGCLTYLQMTAAYLKANVIGLEYPGYGSSKRGETMVAHDASEIKLTSVLLYKLVTEELGFEHSNTYLYGRSIGSGPASFISAECPEVKNFILWSPFSSIAQVTIDWKIEERRRVPKEYHSNFFDNAESVKKTSARLLIIHGTLDDVFKMSHAQDIDQAYNHTHKEKAILCKQEMSHNFFNYEEQILKPILNFIGQSTGSRNYSALMEKMQQGTINGKKPFKIHILKV